MIVELGGECLPAIDFAHADLAEGEQSQTNIAAVSGFGALSCDAG